MVMILSQPADRIRVIGLLVCMTGVGLVWLIRP